MYYLGHDTFKDILGSTSIAIASQAVVYTKAQKIGAGSAFGLSVLLASANGNPDVKVELQVADIATAAKEGIADADGSNWCTQEGGSAIFTSVADKVLHKITINPTPSLYIRLKLTGGISNQTDTTGTFRIVTQQQLGR